MYLTEFAKTWLKKFQVHFRLNNHDSIAGNRRGKLMK